MNVSVDTIRRFVSNKLSCQQQIGIETDKSLASFQEVTD